MFNFPHSKDSREPVLPSFMDQAREVTRNLSPSYFGMVKATGIVSISAQLLGMPWIALALFWLNFLAYVILWALNLLRVILFPRQLFGDMIDHQRGQGFFTFVAGTSILGSQLVLITQHYREAHGLVVQRCRYRFEAACFTSE